MRRVLAFGGFVLLLAPIAFAGVKTDFDHSVDFKHYQTFAWKAARPNPPNGMINNSLVDARIRGAVNQQLTKKGMREDLQKPDVYLVYHVDARSRREINYFPFGGWRWRRWGAWGGDNIFVSRYLQGNLVIDMIDAHTNRLVWRAYGTDSGSYLSDVQSAKNVGKIVANAFKHFPPDVSHSA